MTGEGPDPERVETLPQCLVRNARRAPGRPALREKERGIWREYTRAECLAAVQDFAHGLLALGLERGDKLAVISDNRPQALWAILGAQAVGGVAVPLFQDAIGRELIHVLDHSDARFVVAENQEQVDKLLDVRDRLGKIARIVYYDPKGMRRYADPLLMSWAKVVAAGRQWAEGRGDRFGEAVAAGRGEDLALIVYTSGTTGTPKGAMLTHRNLLASARNAAAQEPFHESDETLSYLPLGWIGEIFWSLQAALWVGYTVNCPERPETVQENLREIGPHNFLAAPRIWENLVSQVQVKIEDAGFVKRRLYRWLMPIGIEVARRRMEGERIPPRLRLLDTLGELLVYGALRDQLGLRRIRIAYTGGAPLGPEVFLFFRGLRVNLKQVYGQTEVAAISCAHRDGAVRLGTVGVPFPGVEIRISETGEILTRSEGVFLGYYKDPVATTEALRDGWLSTGDAGFLDRDGHLVVIDRAKDVTRLDDGTQFAPQYLENRLKFSPYIKEAVVVGQGRPYAAAMLVIDLDNVGTWAERRQLAYTTFTDLAGKPAVYDLVEQEIRRVNRELPPETRVRRYVLLHKELDPDDEEVTRTRKVRRGVVTEKYAPIIEALYREGASVPVTAEITYRDGRRAIIETALAIRAVGEGVTEPALVGRGRAA